MDKNAQNTINELVRKIETLQARKETVIKKEKERKAKAQEKWKGLFMKELIRHVSAAFGEDYEEILLPEKAAALIGEQLGAKKDLLLKNACVTIDEKIPDDQPRADGKS